MLNCIVLIPTFCKFTVGPYHYVEYSNIFFFSAINRSNVNLTATEPKTHVKSIFRYLLFLWMMPAISTLKNCSMTRPRLKIKYANMPAK